MRRELAVRVQGQLALEPHTEGDEPPRQCGDEAEGAEHVGAEVVGQAHPDADGTE